MKQMSDERLWKELRNTAQAPAAMLVICSLWAVSQSIADFNILARCCFLALMFLLAVVMSRRFRAAASELRDRYNRDSNKESNRTQ